MGPSILWSILPVPDDGKLCNIDGMINDRTRRAWRESCYSKILSTAILTCYALALNPGLRCQKPTSCLRHTKTQTNKEERNTGAVIVSTVQYTHGSETILYICFSETHVSFLYICMKIRFLSSQVSFVLAAACEETYSVLKYLCLLAYTIYKNAICLPKS